MANIKTATLDDFEVRKFELLAYGPPGTGKTYFIQYLPEPFIFDIDRGLKTLNSLKDKPKVQFLPRIGAPALTYDEIMLIVSNMIGSPAAFGKTVVLDTLSELERQLLFTEATKNKRPDGIPEQSDYRPVHTKIMNLITALRSLPMHLYVTAGEQKFFDRGGNLSRVEPDFTKKTGQTLPRHFDEVYYFNNKGAGDYTIQTSGTESAYAKSRLIISNNLSCSGVAKSLLSKCAKEKEEKTV